MRKLITLMSFMVIAVVAFAQSRTISGTVIGDDGLPIVGASVVVKGTTTGTVTDLDGNYSLSVPASAETLQFRFIGMQDLEVAINGQTNINITLKSEFQAVDEVIVVAYGTAKKESFTGSASVVKSDDLAKRQVTDVSKALMGQVAGVQTTLSSGQPGQTAKIRVRGVGSINANSDALYVVDGMPYDGEIGAINPSDIENISILKDASSTSLYGARGANGVVMITTKRGRKASDGNVNIDVRIGANTRAIKNYDVIRRPEVYLEKTYEAIYNQATAKLGMSEAEANAYANQVITTDASGGLGYKIYTVPEGQNLIGTNGKLNPNATLGYSDGEYYYTPDNWEDETYQRNPRQEYNLSFTGSSDRASYRVAFGYLDDQGIIDNSNYERFSARISGDYDIKSWMKVGASFNYNLIKSKYPDEQTTTNSSGNAFYLANQIAPVYPMYVRNADGSFKLDHGNRVYDYGDGQSTNFSRTFMSIANPVGDLLYNKEVYTMDIMNSTWYAEISPIDNLKLKAAYGLLIDNTRHDVLGNALYGQSAQYGGTASQYANRSFSFDQQYIADYHLSINEDNNMDITLGFDGYSKEDRKLSGYGQNLYNPNSFYLDNTIDNPQISGEKDEYATLGYFARANYNLLDRYFLNVVYRRDASSRFHKDNRWGNFWAASFAWVLSNESFLESNEVINFLKFKASIGQQGNDAIGNKYAYTDQYIMTGAEGVFADGELDYKGNKDLTWESQTLFNVGFDFNMIDNRLGGSIEFFNRKSDDMLYYKPVASSNGYSQIPMNVGSLSNYGVEIDLNYAIIKNKNITWSVNANASFIRNKINSLHPDLKGELIDGSYIYTEGKSRYRMYLVQYAGVNKETGESMYYIEDENGQRTTTTNYATAVNYKKASDDLLPKVYGGFGTSVSAYGFDFSAGLAYQLGGKIYDSGYARLMHAGSSSYAGGAWHKDILKSWTPENPNSDIPRVNAADSYTQSTSDRFLISSNYLSVTNIALGYTLPQGLISKIYVDKCRVYIAADNLCILTKRQGLNPTMSFTSATAAVFTPARAISGGIQITF